MTCPKLLIRQFLLAYVAIAFCSTAEAQCPASVVTAGLHAPTKVIFSTIGNLLEAEQGTGTPNSGRISIIDASTGVPRTLLDGLPSAINLLGEAAPSGPSGLA